MSTNDVSTSGSKQGGMLSSSAYAVIFGVVVVAAVGIAGYYIGKGQRPAPAPQPAPQQQAHAPALPPGVTRLPAQTFGHWNLDCLQNAQKAKRCGLVLRAVDRNSHRLVLTMSVIENAKGGAVFAVQTPPNAMLQSGVQLGFAGESPLKMNFLACGPAACEAAAQLDDNLQGKLSSKSSVDVSYAAANGKAVHYNLPLDGFSKGYAAWQAAMPQAAAAPSK